MQPVQLGRLCCCTRPSQLGSRAGKAGGCALVSPPCATAMPLPHSADTLSSTSRISCEATAAGGSPRALQAHAKRSTMPDSWSPEAQRAW
jgi:hypothetical protein